VRNNLLKLFLTAFLLQTSAPVWALEPFTTDYCTSYPEGTKNRPDLWKHCCLIHDLYFWAGGSEADRDAADWDLKLCVEETGKKKIAKLIYWAVRAGSRSPVKLPGKKWNNGWPERSYYQELSREDIHSIEQSLTSSEVVPSQYRNQFLNKLHSRLD
jgi:hypothetical protein